MHKMDRRVGRAISDLSQKEKDVSNNHNNSNTKDSLPSNSLPTSPSGVRSQSPYETGFPMRSPNDSPIANSSGLKLNTHLARMNEFKETPRSNSGK